MKRSLVFVFSAIAIFTGSQLRAGDTPEKSWPDAARGKAIALRLCVNCHVISKESTASVPDGVPSFLSIANRPHQTAQHIRGVLIEPHAPMPNMHLSRSEIEDIIAYLDALRKQSSGPPLHPKINRPEPKNVYPDAS